jgi:hypothetical protein
VLTLLVVLTINRKDDKHKLGELKMKMNNFDAAKVLGLSGVINKDDVKKAYIALCKKYHPDINPAGLELMKMLNVAFEVLKDYEGDAPFKSSVDYGDALNAALNVIIDLQGLNIEICGAWVWVTGDTITHRKTLKEAGFKYAAKKKAWYYRPADFKSFSRGKYNLDEIRNVYGSSKPELKKKQAIAA